MARYASLEQWTEEWPADDISVIAPSLLVIGRQVCTSLGGAVDLLCMDGGGNLVVCEFKRGRTPWDVTSQALGAFIIGQVPGARREKRHLRFLSGSYGHPKVHRRKCAGLEGLFMALLHKLATRETPVGELDLAGSGR